MAKFRLTAWTNKIGSKESCEFEVDDEDLTGRDRHDIIDETAQENLHRIMNWDVEEITKDATP